jgi:signal transduction histidine kinase
MEDGGPRASLVEAIDRCVGRCAKLISKVEIIEELNSVSLKRRSLIAALKTSVQELSEKYADAVVEVRYHTENAVVRADEFLEDLLWNILENAILHNHRTSRRVWILVGEEKGGFQVSVADNGAGIPNSDKAILFDVSRRLHGVGIPQICHLADKYGGTIEVRDRVDGDHTQGTEFRLWLPRVEI